MTRKHAVGLLGELDRADEVGAVQLVEEEIEFLNNLIKQLGVKWPPSPGQSRWLKKIHGRIA